MDSVGRRKTIMIGAFINLIGAVLQTASQNLAMVLVGRILAGWAVGLMSMSVPVYQTECAHPKNRGRHLPLLVESQTHKLHRYDSRNRPADDRRRVHRLHMGRLWLIQSPED